MKEKVKNYILGSMAYQKKCLDLRSQYQGQGREAAQKGDADHKAMCMLYWAEGSKTRNSCIFTDILDCVANNTILECIKFNCPIILRRTSSAEEYLGVAYPLFFNNKDELSFLKEEGFLLDLIIQAHIYLKGMDKSRFKIDTFNRKIKYEQRKGNRF